MGDRAARVVDVAFLATVGGLPVLVVVVLPIAHAYELATWHATGQQSHPPAMNSENPGNIGSTAFMTYC
jgi:hypothetical protein